MLWCLGTWPNLSTTEASFTASKFKTGTSILKLIFPVQSKAAWCHRNSESVLELHYRPGQCWRPAKEVYCRLPSMLWERSFLPHAAIFIHEFCCFKSTVLVRTYFIMSLLLSFNFRLSECKVVGMIQVQTWKANSERNCTDRNSCIVVFFEYCYCWYDR